jgi:hypothetical protein
MGIFNVAATMNGMVKFNGMNYAEWANHIDFQLGIINLDMTIVMEKPATPINESSNEDKKKYDLWERANRLSLNFMRMMIAENVKPLMPNTGLLLRGACEVVLELAISGVKEKLAIRRIPIFIRGKENKVSLGGIQGSSMVTRTSPTVISLLASK